MRRLTVLLAVLGALLLSALPASASQGKASLDAGIVDVVLAVSGDEGFDRNARDFDLLREALVATDLAGAVAASDDITVFAPNDFAFKVLARELGWDRTGGEEGAFGFLATTLGVDTIADVLLYHVGTERVHLRQLFRGGDVTTLLGPELEYRRFRVIDADTDDRNARVTFPWFVPASNGNIVIIDRVLRPVDLP